MCGIVGIINRDGAPVEPGMVGDMLAMLRHRGPDDEGVFIDGPVALGHARLSIIDVEGGHQPMCNEDGSVWIAFNGEIFNYVELREELFRSGHQFRTRSDTEVLLRLYEQEGPDCVRRLNGQWAFAIWDRREHTVFLSRDRLGVRPLFYAETGKSLVWASEMKALAMHPAVDMGLDLRALDEVFTFWVCIPPRTIFRGVRELPPGCSIIWKDGKINTSPYWDLDFTASNSPAEDDQSYAEGLLELLKDATRIRLRSDVPVGCYLSGGIDSSFVTALVRSIHRGPLKTFSITFDDADLDERSFQTQVAEFLQTEHQTSHAADEQLVAAFPEVVWHAEAPLLRSAPAPMYLLSKLVRENGYKVVLTGEGADEILGGYDIFKEAKIRQFWAAQPNSKLRPLLLRRLYPYMPALQMQAGAYLKKFFRPAHPEDGFDSHRSRWELTSQLKGLFSEDVKAELRDCRTFDAIADGIPLAFREWDYLSRAQYLEAKVLLPGYILSSQGDRMAMAHAVEGRYPFLDHRVVEFAAKMPARLKIKVLREKYLLKQIAAPMLPHDVVRRPKQPYRAPDGRSFFRCTSQDFVRDVLSTESVRESAIFEPRAVAMLLDKFAAGKVIGVKDNMALMGVLSTQLLVKLFRQAVSGSGHGKLRATAEGLHRKEFSVQG